MKQLVFPDTDPLDSDFFHWIVDLTSEKLGPERRRTTWIFLYEKQLDGTAPGWDLDLHDLKIRHVNHVFKMPLGHYYNYRLRKGQGSVLCRIAIWDCFGQTKAFFIG